MTSSAELDVERLAKAMHDADWHKPPKHPHPWGECGIEGHRDYYPRVAALYAAKYTFLRGPDEEPAA